MPERNHIMDNNQKNTQKNSKLNELVDTALENLRGLVDANTVIGTPIVTASGTTVIPVSKVSIGIAGGGNDFSRKTEQDGKVNFSGGGGTGLTMLPLAFLVISPDGSVELLNIAAPTKSGKPAKGDAAGGGTDIAGALETLFDKGPDALLKVKEMFGKKKKASAEEEAAAELDMDIVTKPEETDDEN